MYAIVKIGGKQYRVAVGDVIYLDRLKAEEKSSYVIEDVVAIVEEKSSNFGAPFVKGATVTANVLKNGKAKKIRVFKYKPKKNYSRRYGHRQHYTALEITAINSK